MPRKAREQSRTNIYHVMLRGINRQTIFEEEQDMNMFMTQLKRCKDISDFKLYAFCLMPNHVHLLMETGEEPLERIFKRLGGSYAIWYNRKYERVGHLFQDRFKSEKVENEPYFTTVFRYIMQNPMKAGLESRPGTYKWSSFRAYERGAGTLTDTDYALTIFGRRETMIDFLCEENKDKAMDEDDTGPYLSDLEAKKFMEELIHVSTIADFQKLREEEQRENIRRMYEKGLPARQISRLTGRNRKTVTRILGRPGGGPRGTVPLVP